MATSIKRSQELKSLKIFRSPEPLRLQTSFWSQKMQKTYFPLTTKTTFFLFPQKNQLKIENTYFQGHKNTKI